MVVATIGATILRIVYRMFVKMIDVCFRGSDKNVLPHIENIMEPRLIFAFVNTSALPRHNDGLHNDKRKLIDIGNFHNAASTRTINVPRENKVLTDLESLYLTVRNAEIPLTIQMRTPVIKNMIHFLTLFWYQQRPIRRFLVFLPSRFHPQP